MYGWRGRLGLIVPSSNTTNEPEFRAHLLEGVSLHAARMRLESVDADALSAMADEAERCASLLATADVDAVAYGCTTGSLVHGPGYDREIEERVSAAAGAPAVATAASVVRALDHLGAERLAVTTPYVEDLVAREASFLDDAGFDVVDIEGLGIEENTDIGRESPESVYRRVRALPTDEVDAVFVSCTNYRTFETLPALESDLGLPVVSSNAATLWDALRTLDVDGSEVGLGRLFEW
jgi:maleate isomerase